MTRVIVSDGDSQSDGVTVCIKRSQVIHVTDRVQKSDLCNTRVIRYP